ncbi:H/ACA ribonucleoprotein complex subunit 2, partial [Eudyptes schlegeli]
MAREKQPEAAAEAEGTPERSYREQLDYLNPIAQPLASRKLTRKLYKCIRKGPAGAGAGAGAGVSAGCQASPLGGDDPALPHGLTLFPQDLGAAAGSKRPTCVIMIKPHEEYRETYDECLEEVEALPLPL